jgi:hypothetical protein
MSSTSFRARVRRDLASLGRLSWSDRWLLVESVATTAVVALGLRVLGLNRLRSWLQRLAPLRGAAGQADTRPDAAITDRTVRLARIVGIGARRGPLGGQCLHRSLTLWWLLRRRGIDSSLKIGARLEDRDLEAHAWVEREGVILNDSERSVRRYAVLEPAARVLRRRRVPRSRHRSAGG